MLNIMIVEGTVIEHGTLGAELMNVNHIAETMTRMDLKRICKNMEVQSGQEPLTHLMDQQPVLATHQLIRPKRSSRTAKSQ